MIKEELKYRLLLEQRTWSYYVNNSEFMPGIVELLNEEYPYAINLFFQAPNKFIVDDYQQFQDIHFKYVKELYYALHQQDGKTVRKKQQEAYERIVKRENLIESNKTFVFLKKEIWDKCTENLLDCCSLFHKKALEDPQIDKIEKDFHDKCLDGILENRRVWKVAKKEAEKYFTQKELLKLQETLLSEQYDESQDPNILNLIKRHADKLYSKEIFEMIVNNCKKNEWMETYIKVLVGISLCQEKKEFLEKIILSRWVLGFNKTLLLDLFEIFEPNEQFQILHELNYKTILEILLEYYIQKYNRPNDILNLIIAYIEKYQDSGLAIYNAVAYIKNGRSIVNALPDVIEKYAKRWMLNYNYHKNEDEIVNVVDALELVGRVEKLFVDFSFWLEMETCDAFIRVIDNLALSIGFEKCFEMIRKNYFAALAYGYSSLSLKWVQSANSLVINNDTARKPYIYFVEKLLDENSVLDSLSKMMFFRKTVDFLIDQVNVNRELLQLERNKVQTINCENIEDIIHHICVPINKLEKMIVAYSDDDTLDKEMLQTVRDLIGKVRLEMGKVGIFPVVNVEYWTKQKVLPYDPATQMCLEELAPAERVVCLSMGMMNKEKTYFERATVKKYVGGGKTNGGKI